jgi:nitrogen fixation NifU-like protein
MTIDRLYHQHLLEHYRNSPFKRVVADAQITTKLYNPSCGDKVAYTVRIDNEVIADIGFDASGCVLSGAAASLLAGHVIGKHLSAVQSVTTETLLELIGMPVGPVRLKCVLLPLEALQKGMREYDPSSPVHADATPGFFG